MVKKDLKTVKSKAQTQRKINAAAQKHASASIVWNPLKANGSPLTPIRRCFTRLCCPESLLHILIEIRLASQMAGLHLPPIPLGENVLSAGKLRFCHHICQP
jgi:hypothetical protein